MLKWIVIVPVALLLLLLIAGQAGLLRGKPPADLGVREGKLKRPSKTPNSVSSQAALWPDHPQTGYAQIAPLPAQTGAEGPLVRIRARVAAMPGATVVKAETDYLHVTFTTPLLKFTDDAEFWFDPVAGVVQVRSASRLGRKDFGVNRQRIETLREALAQP